MGDCEDKTDYAVCAIILASQEKEEENKWRRKRGPTRRWRKRRAQKGAFLNLNQELRGEDPTSYKRWLRVTEEQFDHLLHEISPRIQKQKTKFGEPISAAERLTITLRYLATGNTFRDLSWEFRIGERTVSYIILETCAALYEFLKYTFEVPTSKEHWRAVSKQFLDRWNVPHCLGAIDGKHIVIRKPINSGSHYQNYKGTESIVLLAVVDANYKFRYIDVGTQGRISDGGVWNKCNLKELIDVNTLDMPPAHPLPGQDIPTPYVFLADNAFGLKPYILKPYGGNDLTLEERICNYRISRGRQVVETAFGSFANRLRVFLNPILLQPDKVRTLVLAGCALHNFLRSHESTESWPVNYVDREDVETGTTLPGAWRTEIPIQPGTDLHLPQVATTYSNYYSTEAKAVRENFKAFFTSDVGAVYWQHRFV
nr:uncharacterized protein LOC132777828 isoform X1 [Anolis sagrei ordinatus]XP_060636291.1 uncharacterized protein LOC132777828 isoform X1 [Anolis sagrei ordinatus]